MKTIDHFIKKFLTSVTSVELEYFVLGTFYLIVYKKIFCKNEGPSSGKNIIKRSEMDENYILMVRMTSNKL